MTQTKGLVKWFSLREVELSVLQKVKDSFFKVAPTKARKSYFYDDGGRLKFLFYWIIEVPKSSLFVESRQIMDVLE